MNKIHVILPLIFPLFTQSMNHEFPPNETTEQILEKLAHAVNATRKDLFLARSLLKTDEAIENFAQRTLKKKKNLTFLDEKRLAQRRLQVLHSKGTVDELIALTKESEEGLVAYLKTLTCN